MRFLLVCTLALAGLAARAQQVVPLGGDAARTEAPARPTAATQRTTALALPFFDDFTTPRDGTPRTDLWVGAGPGYPLGDGTTGNYRGGGAYVSNRLAVNPPTRGTATLDGLRANGLPYRPDNASANGGIDTLTSQPLNLAALSVGSNVYLSFAWQAGSVQGPPSQTSGTQPVRLVLEFLSSSGLWAEVWRYTSEAKRTVFRQQIFPLNQASYFFNGFRFRLRAQGNQNISSDAFGLDYVYVNSNRTAADTLFADVALSRPLSNPLRRFTSLPTWQFAAASTSELSASAGTTLNRLSASGILPLPVAWQGVVRELRAGGFGPATWLAGSNPIDGGARQVPIAGNPGTAPLPTAGATRTYRYQVALNTQETNPLTLPNDSISRDVTLADYYAFDDGTAEAAFGLASQSTGPTSYFAYALDLNKADAVKSVRLAPVFNNIPAAGSGGDGFQNRSVTVAVWGDDPAHPGQPGPLLASKAGTLLNPLNPANAGTTVPVFQEIAFDQPVTVTGRCYVGYGQASNSQFPLYGYDANNALPTNVAFRQVGGTWGALSLPNAPPGAVMVRAVMNNAVMPTRAALALSTQYGLYPNPGAAGTIVAVEGPAFRRAALLDVLGRPVWQQPAAEAGQPSLRLPATLPAGTYLVQLALPDGQVATRRLVVE